MSSITRHNSHQMENATLVARIWYGSTLLKTLTKTISAYPGFYGTYNGNPINYPVIINAQPSSSGTIYSPYLKGAFVFLTGNITPTSWFHNTATGYLNISFPSTLGSLTIRIACVNGEEYILPIRVANVIDNFFIEVQDGQMNVMLGELRESMWTLEIYKSSTGEKVFTQEIRGHSGSVNTSGWPSGVYIVRATIGNEVLSEKITIK